MRILTGKGQGAERRNRSPNSVVLQALSAQCERLLQEVRHNPFYEQWLEDLQAVAKEGIHAGWSLELIRERLAELAREIVRVSGGVTAPTREARNALQDLFGIVQAEMQSMPEVDLPILNRQERTRAALELRLADDPRQQQREDMQRGYREANGHSSRTGKSGRPKTRVVRTF